METVLKLLLNFVVGLAFFALVNFGVVWLWNEALVPAVTFAQEVGYWQMFGIVTLAKVLVK